MSDCFYIDADDTWTNLTLKLLVDVTNYKNNAVPDQDIDLSIIIYTNNNCPTSLNNLDNSNYFTILFLTLFLFGTDGHLTPNERSRKIKISINV